MDFAFAFDDEAGQVTIALSGTPTAWTSLYRGPRAANARYFSGTLPRCHWKNSVGVMSMCASGVSISTGEVARSLVTS